MRTKRKSNRIFDGKRKDLKETECRLICAWAFGCDYDQLGDMEDVADIILRWNKIPDHHEKMPSDYTLSQVSNFVWKKWQRSAEKKIFKKMMSFFDSLGRQIVILKKCYVLKRDRDV